LEKYAILGKLGDIDEKLESIEKHLRQIESKLDDIQRHMA